MKKAVFAFLFFLLAFQLVSAVDFNILESYSKGETVIAKLSGNFLAPVESGNVLFYQNHVRIPFEYDIAKIGNDYYVYFLTSGKDEGSYAISLEEIKYMEGSSVSEENIVKNFSITNVSADFSIDPGFITASGSFSIEVQNLLDESLSVTVQTEDISSGEREIFVSLPENFKEADISLSSGEIKKINFNVAAGSSSIQEITIKSDTFTYKIPVYLLASSEEQIDLNPAFEFNPSDMVFALPTDTTTKRIIYFFNTGDKDVSNIELELSESLVPFVKLSTSKINNLGAGENTSLELLISSSNATEVQGTLKAKTNETLDSFFISLKFSEGVQLVENGTTDVLNCEELDGFICNYETQTCSGEVVKAKDNVCCIGSCKAIKQSSAGRVIAIILVFLAIGGLVWFYFAKYKRTKRKAVDLLKIARGNKAEPATATPAITNGLPQLKPTGKFKGFKFFKKK